MDILNETLKNEVKSIIVEYELDCTVSEFADRVNWDSVSECQKLSECFIREFADRVDWEWVSANQKLSEDLIREFADRVDWEWVSEFQKLSESFIREFADRVDTSIQLKKHRPKTQKQREYEIKDYAKKHGLTYKNGWLYAFRNHDIHGRGQFNKTLFYESGKRYRDWHCDMDADTENSFGLGIWPEGNTAVKVHVDDWGVAVNRADGKARVWGFTVL